MVVGCGTTAHDVQGAGVVEVDPRLERTTRFDGQVLHIELPRPDGTKEQLNSLRDAQYGWSYRPAIPNFAGRRWTLRKTTRDSTSLVYVLVSWDNDRPTDYLAAGYWLQFPAQRSEEFSLRDARRAIFIDGTELDVSNPPQMPASGTTPYIGSVAGIYGDEHGSDWGDIAEPVAVEEIAAAMRIRADFSDNTLTGCIGCVGDIAIQRAHLYSALGRRVSPPAALPTDYELHFGVTPINPNGAFEQTEVMVAHPERTITHTAGNWIGRFLRIPDADGYPRLVAGLTRVEFEEADGSKGFVNAIFTGLGDSLRPSAEMEVLP